MRLRSLATNAKNKLCRSHDVNNIYLIDLLLFPVIDYPCHLPFRFRISFN